MYICGEQTTCKDGSFLPPLEVLGSNLGHQALWQMLLPAEASCWLVFHYFKAVRFFPLNCSIFMSILMSLIKSVTCLLG